MSVWIERQRRELLGRPMPKHLSDSGEVQLSFMGWAAGFSESDIHCNRLYQLILIPDGDGNIGDVEILVVGELISPCSGYQPETLDEFDFPNVLRWCRTIL